MQPVNGLWVRLPALFLHKEKTPFLLCEIVQSTMKSKQVWMKSKPYGFDEIKSVFISRRSRISSRRSCSKSHSLCLKYKTEYLPVNFCEQVQDYILLSLRCYADTAPYHIFFLLHLTQMFVLSYI